MSSAIEKYDSRDFKKEFAGVDISKYIGEENAAKTFFGQLYNQKLVDTYSCTGQAACGTITDVTNIVLPLSFRKKVWERQIETGAVPGIGDYLSNGMKQAVKLFNEEFPELKYKLVYNRIENIMNIPELFEILEVSSVHTGYAGALYKDSQDNGIIDNPDNVDGGGHSIRLLKGWIDGKSNNPTIKYGDNYEGVHKFNIVTIPNFSNNKDFFTGGYWIEKVEK